VADGGSSWTDIAGATLNIYTLTTAGGDNAALFRAGASWQHRESQQ